MPSSVQRSLRSLAPVITVAIFALVLSSCSQPNKASQRNTPSRLPESSVSSSAMNVPSSKSSLSTDVSSSAQSSSVKEQSYRDGTFTAEGAYRSPAGNDQVMVTVSLKGDMIVGATFKGLAASGKSQKFQHMFAEGFTDQVVGKSIESLDLTIVNGSSLTPKGFMDAVEKIKAEAKA